MNFPLIFDTAVEIGYQLAMSGAETYRVEESINRILAAYGAKADVFAIPNCMTATVTTPTGECMTRLRRIGFHGNDMDTLERYSNLSRKICNEKPNPETASKWLEETRASCRHYSLPLLLVGHMLSSAGFALFFGGTAIDIVISVLCGIVVCVLSYITGKLHINNFFSTIVTSFFMALTAYLFGSLGANADVAIIGTLMILVPGLIFTNAIRDIIFGDTNSGINRIVQVIMIAGAIGLGTGFARSLIFGYLGPQTPIPAVTYSPLVQCFGAAIGCAGFCILFNIHGRGISICILGGTLSWAVYLIFNSIFHNSMAGYFAATLFSSVFAETMARIRHFPALTYLLISIFPLIPGAGIYYTTSYLADSNWEGFMQKGGETICIAGILAIGILMISTIVRGIMFWRQLQHR